MIFKPSAGEVNPSSYSLCARPSQAQLNNLHYSNQLPGQKHQSRQKHIFKCTSALGFPCLTRWNTELPKNTAVPGIELDLVLDFTKQLGKGPPEPN